MSARPSGSRHRVSQLMLVEAVPKTQQLVHQRSRRDQETVDSHLLRTDVRGLHCRPKGILAHRMVLVRIAGIWEHIRSRSGQRIRCTEDIDSLARQWNEMRHVGPGDRVSPLGPVYGRVGPYGCAQIPGWHKDQRYQAQGTPHEQCPLAAVQDAQQWTDPLRIGKCGKMGVLARWQPARQVAGQIPLGSSSSHGIAKHLSKRLKLPLDSVILLFGILSNHCPKKSWGRGFDTYSGILPDSCLVPATPGQEYDENVMMV